MQELTPEMIAQKLFSKSPEGPCSINLIPESGEGDDDLTSFNFEILITIYLEGFMYILDMISEGNADKINEKYENMNIDDLLFPNPWFNSFGYKINVEEIDDMSKYEEMRKKSYCKTVLSFTLADKIHFMLNNIDKKYRFFLTPTYQKTTNIKNIYTLLKKENKFYKISFDKVELIQHH